MARAKPQQVVRTENEREVFALLTSGTPLTRSKISRDTGLSKPAILGILDRLTERGLVKCLGATESQKPGPKALLFEAEPSLGYALAIALQLKGLRMRIHDINGRLVAERHLEESVIAFTAEHLVSQIQEFCQAEGLALDAIVSTVIGIPGRLDPVTHEVKAWDLPQWTTNIHQAWEEATGNHLRCENGTNLMALAEREVRPELNDFVLLALGQGLGCATVTGGTLHRGVHGGAGEIGFVPRTEDELVRQDSGQVEVASGWQSYIGGSAILELAANHGLTADDAADVVARSLARSGDPDAEAFLTDFCDRLALIISTLCLVVDPREVVLAGEVGIAGGDGLARRISQRLNNTNMPMAVEISSTSVPEHSVSVGAAALSLPTLRSAMFSA